MDQMEKSKEAIEFLRLFGHTVVPLSNGNYYIKWVSCNCVEVNALDLVKTAERIRVNEQE